LDDYVITAPSLISLQITAANTKSTPVRIICKSCFLTTTSNSGDISASGAQVLPVWRTSATDSINFPQLAWGPRYIASGLTPQKTPLSTVFILLLWMAA
jgi:hypothetical protein